MSTFTVTYSAKYRAPIFMVDIAMILPKMPTEREIAM